MKRNFWAHGCAVPMAIALLVSPTGLDSPVHAENLDHLKQLLNTRQCAQCDLSNAGLAYARLPGANLRGANLSRANLSQADLSGADLSGADLSGASLVGANLTRTNLIGANLTGTDLRQAYLIDAILEPVNTNATNLRQAVGIPTNVARPEDFYQWGTEEVKRGNHGAAANYYNQAIGLNPRFAAAYMGRGLSRFQLGDLQGSLQDLKQAELLFQDQGNPEGVKSAQQFTQAIVASQQPQGGGGGGGFFGFLSSLASVALSLFLQTGISF